MMTFPGNLETMVLPTPPVPPATAITIISAGKSGIDPWRSKYQPMQVKPVDVCAACRRRLAAPVGALGLRQTR